MTGKSKFDKMAKENASRLAEQNARGFFNQQDWTKKDWDLVSGKIIVFQKNDIGMAELKKEVSAFAAQFSQIASKNADFSSIKNYGKFTLMYKNQDVTLKDNKLWLNDSTALAFVDLVRLEEFSWHIRDGRGDFYHKGKFGKDFKVYYKGKELEYKERTLMYNGTKLNAPLL